MEDLDIFKIEYLKFFFEKLCFAKFFPKSIDVFSFIHRHIVNLYVHEFPKCNEDPFLLVYLGSKKSLSTGEEHIVP